MTAILWVIGAFLLYFVGLPLLGFMVGFTFRVAVPYLVGAAALLIPVAEFLAIGIAVVWASTIVWSRQTLKQRHKVSFPWYEGHFHGMAHLASYPRRIRT